MDASGDIFSSSSPLDLVNDSPLQKLNALIEGCEFILRYVLVGKSAKPVFFQRSLNKDQPGVVSLLNWLTQGDELKLCP